MSFCIFDQIFILPMIPSLPPRLLKSITSHNEHITALSTTLSLSAQYIQQLNSKQSCSLVSTYSILSSLNIFSSWIVNWTKIKMILNLIFWLSSFDKDFFYWFSLQAPAQNVVNILQFGINRLFCHVQQPWKRSVDIVVLNMCCMDTNIVINSAITIQIFWVIKV